MGRMWRGMFHECGHCVWDAGCLSHAGGGGLLLEGPERLPQRACQPAASRMLLCLSGAAHMRCHELQVSWCVWESGSACFMSYGPWARQRLREAMGPSEIGRNGMGLSARRSAAPQHPLAVVLGEQAGVHAAQQVHTSGGPTSRTSPDARASSARRSSGKPRPSAAALPSSTSYEPAYWSYAAAAGALDATAAPCRPPRDSAQRSCTTGLCHAARDAAARWSRASRGAKL